MNINLFSHYDHFPNHKPVPFERSVDMYNDEFVYKATEGSYAILIEPRSIQPNVYEWMEQNYKRFKYVFTHDSILLNKCDNAKLILWGMGNANYNSFNDIPKTKNISMVSSDKELCELHKARKNLALALKDCPLVDTYGTFDGGEFVDTETIYAPYRFSIVIENYIDDYWFTEKICNCFANKTIPIYYGAREINEFFNWKGIIDIHKVEDFEKTIRTVSLNPSGIYENYLGAIDDNYKRVRKFERFEDWFYKEYGGLLENGI